MQITLLSMEGGGVYNIIKIFIKGPKMIFLGQLKKCYVFLPAQNSIYIIEPVILQVVIMNS